MIVAMCPTCSCLSLVCAAAVILCNVWSELTLHFVCLQVYGVDSHRLALALARQRKLAPIIREAVLGEMGINSGNVRLVNLV